MTPAVPIPAPDASGPAQPSAVSTSARQPATVSGAEPVQRAPLWAAAGGWPAVAVVLVILVVTRIGQLMFLTWLDPRVTTELRDRLLTWDGRWFLQVATAGYPRGYTYGPGGELVGNGLAFFPLYPMLVRAVAATGLDAGDAALTVTWIASGCAAVALHLLGTTLYSRRVGYALVVLCCAQPLSVVLSMGYSEALFLAVVAAMFVAAHRGAWPAAGLFGLAAALTRPTGVAAAVALAVAASLVLVRGGAGRQRWTAVAAATVAVAGVPGYLLWVAHRVGDLDAWFTIQSAGWGTSFDAGASTARFLGTTLRGSDGWVPMSVALLLICAVVAAVVALAGRPWLPLAVYGIIALVLVVGQAGYYHSKPRLLVPVLVILIPPALAAARARPWVAVLALSGYAAFGLWYGAYLLTVWTYTI